MPGDFWEQRLTAVKSRLIMNVIDYCDIYDILHDELFNADNAKNELVKLIDTAVNTYINDNKEYNE